MWSHVMRTCSTVSYKSAWGVSLYLCNGGWGFGSRFVHAALLFFSSIFELRESPLSYLILPSLFTLNSSSSSSSSHFKYQCL